MQRNNVRILIGVVALLAVLGGFWAWRENQKVCCAFPDDPDVVGGDVTPFKPRLGLMTSLPLYWPLGAEFGDLASGDVEVPWQRAVLEQDHELVLLDTLSPIPGLGTDDPVVDPLEGLERLAIIQPRGLSPADNAAIDEWVRSGGQLLLVLDPILTGEYNMALGDPRRPIDAVLIPPVLARWGLSFSAPIHELGEDQFFDIQLRGSSVSVAAPGRIEVTDPSAADCELLGEGVIARCAIGDGKVTLMTDAAIFEGAGAHSHGLEAADHDHAGGIDSAENAKSIRTLLEFSF